MQGRRVPDGTEPHTYEPGDYGKWPWPDHPERVDWMSCVPSRTPDGEVAVGSLRGHEVVEHEDGTITVSPSILVSTSRDGKRVEVWHGWLERGVWRSA